MHISWDCVTSVSERGYLISSEFKERLVIYNLDSSVKGTSLQRSRIQWTCWHHTFRSISSHVRHVNGWLPPVHNIFMNISTMVDSVTNLLVYIGRGYPSWDRVVVVYPHPHNDKYWSSATVVAVGNPRPNLLNS